MEIWNALFLLACGFACGYLTCLMKENPYE